MRSLEGRTWCLVGLLVFSVYLRSLAATVTFQDSGELLAGVQCLGIPHSPGSPFWCLAAGCLSRIPLGHMAFRVHLLSALSSAGLASLLIHMMQRRFAQRGGKARVKDRILAVSAVLCFSLGVDAWLKSTIAEVYLPSMLLFVAVMVCKEDRRKLPLAWLFLSLNFAVHQSSCLLLPWLVAWTWKAGSRVWTRCLLCGIIGGSSHLYMPIRSAVDPLMDWGDPKGMEGFLWCLLRVQWGGMKISLVTLPGVRSILRFMLPWVPYPLPVGLLLMVGLLLGWKRDRLQSHPFLGFALFYTVWMALTLLATGGLSAVQYLSPSLGEFFLLWYLALCLVWPLEMGLGACTPGRLVWVLLLPVGLFLSSHAWCNKRDHWYADRLATKLLWEMDRDSLVLAASDDLSFTLYYETQVEGKCPNLAAVSRKGLQGRRGYLQSVKRSFSGVDFAFLPYTRPGPFRQGGEVVPITARPVFWHLAGDEDRMLLQLLPGPGLAMRVSSPLPPSTSWDNISRLSRQWEVFWEEFMVDRRFFLDENGPVTLMWFAGGPAGYFLDRGETDAARIFLEKLVRIRPLVTSYWLELARVELQCGLVEQARISCAEALRLDPRCKQARALATMLLWYENRIQPGGDSLEVSQHERSLHGNRSRGLGRHDGGSGWKREGNPSHERSVRGRT